MDWYADPFLKRFFLQLLKHDTQVPTHFSALPLTAFRCQVLGSINYFNSDLLF